MLVAFGVLFLVLPLVNLLGLAWHRSIPLSETMRIVRGMPTLMFLFWVTPPAVGIGLLRVSRWGWWLFLVYAPSLALYNLIVYLRVATLYNTAAIGQTLIALGAMAYFLRRDAYAPYLSATARGWRHARRVPLVVPISIDGVARKTINLSGRGCYVEWPGCDRRPGDAVALELELLGQRFTLTGGITRIGATGIGVAFRNLDAATAERLEAALARMPRDAQAAPASGA